ncbi:PREDICTED: uncharacterized protein LOC105146879 [Acromyrmex echinatior]|uniref:uncharacterized protein LOC105146879 n=1 Tax=Acromyrmex echinatior TaxID=103372 RepID=UPI000580D675|nr:PREDICTED: uncharacterized protein LOC105146879 [Acromyrmex echinatior]
MATSLLDPIKQRFYIERYKKENKLIKVRETFVPTTCVKPLTGKFYAKHDVISPLDVKEDDINLIKRQMEMIPTDIYSFRPPSVNMEYGWFTTPLIPISKDPRLRFSRKQSDFVTYELLRRKLQRGLPEERFFGVPFKT